MTDLLKDLNDMQRKAVLHAEGALLILAGAGSGKTRVLAHRIAYILKEGKASPWEILALTFTNKAAEEMRQRVDKLVKHGQGMWVHTFHATGVRILRKHASKLGLESSFNILDSKEQLNLVKECMKELNLDAKRFSPQAILKTISNAKNELINSKKYIPTNYFENKVQEVFEIYEKKKKTASCLDFDDLLFLCIVLFRKYPEVLQEYQQRFKYVLVDEYQDTNYLQYLLVTLLVGRRKNICVVGDDDQSIYRFRGADIRNILEFEKDFPEAVLIKLEENYRSCGNILKAASNIVRNNVYRKDKELWTRNPPGDKIYLYDGEDEWGEARFIAHEIKKIRLDYPQIAVLYRVNAQSRVLEEVCLQEGIAYTIIGSLKFYDRKEIKDITAYLKVLANYRDDLSLKRIINTPRRGIGDKTFQKIAEVANNSGNPILTVLQDNSPSLFTGTAAGKKLKSFIELMSSLDDLKKSLSIKELVQNILTKTGYLEKLKDEGSEESLNRIENLREYLSVANEFDVRYAGSPEDRLVSFLDRISLVSDIDTLPDSSPPVVLMTLHSAKGLEFSAVFMAGMEEKLLPHARSLEDDDIEEERRLCYVGITRAKEKLYFTWAKRRSNYSSETAWTLPSRFIQEISPDLIISSNAFSIDSHTVMTEKAFSGIHTDIHTDEHRQESRPATEKIEQSEQFSQDLWRVKQNIFHSKWGKGIIREVKKLDDDKVLTVFFPQEGEKKIMARYAPIKPS